MTSTLDRETALSDLDLARAEFRDRLVDAGLLVRSSLDGLYGRSGVFEDVIDVIDTAVRAASNSACARLSPENVVMAPVRLGNDAM